MDNREKIKQKNTFIYFISIIAALAGLLFGFDTGVISGAILFIRQDFILTSAATEIVVSAVLLGAFLGCLISGQVTDRYGRRKIIIVTACIFIVGSIVTALARNIDILIVGRFVLGIAIGIASFAAPLYLAEVAPYRIRGLLVSLNQLAITIGILASYIVDYYFAQYHAWRWMLAVGAIPGIILLLGMYYLPQSPRWLVLLGMRDKAKSILQKIRATQHVDEELHAISSSLQQEKGSWRHLLQPRIRMVLMIAVGLAFFQQATGINTIIYYAPTIFKMAGFQSAEAAILATAGVGIVNVLFTVVSLPLIDRLGRRPLLLFGLTGMLTSLAILSYAFAHHGNLGVLRWITLASFIIYIACFAISLGPIMWLMCSEIFPLHIRGVGMSIATATNWLFNLIVAVSFLSLIDKLGASDTFALFFFISIFGLAFVYWFVPETKNVSLEQIEQHLHDGKSARQLGQVVGQ